MIRQAEIVNGTVFTVVQDGHTPVDWNPIRDYLLGDRRGTRYLDPVIVQAILEHIKVAKYYAFNTEQVRVISVEGTAIVVTWKTS